MSDIESHMSETFDVGNNNGLGIWIYLIQCHQISKQFELKYARIIEFSFKNTHLAAFLGVFLAGWSHGN